MSSTKVDVSCPTSIAKSVEVKRKNRGSISPQKNRGSISPQKAISLKHEWDNSLAAADATASQVSKSRSKSPSKIASINRYSTPSTAPSNISIKEGSKNTTHHDAEIGLAKSQYPVGEEKKENITLLNFFNFVFFTAKVICTFDLGFETIHPLYPTCVSILEENQTLVSPIILTYLLWYPIFAFDGLFCIAQFVSPFREISNHTVKLWYIFSCILQVGCMVLFSHGIMQLSFALAFSLMCVLLKIRKNMYNWKKKPSFFEYWLCYFPFSFHGGFLISIVAVHVNIIFVQLGLQESILFDMSLFTVVILMFVNLYVTVVLKRPDIVIATVTCYVLVGIYLALSNPSEVLTASYNYNEITKVSNITATSICLTIMIIVLRIFQIMINAYCFKSSGESTAIPPAQQEEGYIITVCGNGGSLSDMSASTMTRRTEFSSLKRGYVSKGVPSSFDSKGQSLLGASKC